MGVRGMTFVSRLVSIGWRRVYVLNEDHIFYNSRGLGGRLKKREIQKLIQHHQLGMICIQEIKLEAIVRISCASMWGSDDFEWTFKAS